MSTYHDTAGEQLCPHCQQEEGRPVEPVRFSVSPGLWFQIGAGMLSGWALTKLIVWLGGTL